MRNGQRFIVLGGNHETLGHFGKSAKMVFSNQFGADQELGIVAVARYEQRSRNSVKRWQKRFGGDPTPTSW